jgi:hypothetical protein
MVLTGTVCLPPIIVASFITELYAKCTGQLHALQYETLFFKSRNGTVIMQCLSDCFHYILCTVLYDIKYLCVLPTHCVYVDDTVLRINSYYFLHKVK